MLPIVMLPTPEANLGEHGRANGQPPERRKAGGHAVNLADVACYLPTPRASDGEKGGPNQRGSKGDLTMPSAAPQLDGTTWGDYEPAIRRWESVMGPAPSPVLPGAKGQPRLSAIFTEWMMGQPAGWITDPAIWVGMTDSAARNAQLKACGNGVVTQQAEAAFSDMLAVFDMEVAA